MSDHKYKAMTEQLRLTNPEEEVANYLRWIIASDLAKEYWEKQMNKANEIPRRNNFSLNQPSEIAISFAINQVENMGADIKLTDAVCLLQKAKDLVSDFIDGDGYNDLNRPLIN